MIYGLISWGPMQLIKCGKYTSKGCAHTLDYIRIDLFQCKIFFYIIEMVLSLWLVAMIYHVIKYMSLTLVLHHRHLKFTMTWGVIIINPL